MQGVVSAVGRVGAAWEVPGVRAPHDLAAIASPVRLAGKERPLALLIAETWEVSDSRLHKFILLPQGKSYPPGPFPWSALASGKFLMALHKLPGSCGIDIARRCRPSSCRQSVRL